jgi:hypothetical protein
MFRTTTIAAILALALPTAGLADDDDTPSFGMAGVLSSGNKEDLPPVILSAGMPLSDAPWELQSGTYYEFEIQGDGSQELALVGPEFFRAIWIDEIVVEGLGYYMKIPGSTGETQRLEITIK